MSARPTFVSGLALLALLLLAMVPRPANGGFGGWQFRRAIEKLRLDGKLSPAAMQQSGADYSNMPMEQQAANSDGPMPPPRPSSGRRIHDLTAADEHRGRHSVVQHHSLHPPFTGYTAYDDPVAFWDYGASTVLTERYIRLTPAISGRHGYLWNAVANEVHSWEAFVGVAVHSTTPLGADGLAFWYRDAPSKIDSEAESGPMLGASDDGFTGLGVMLDSYDNDGDRDNPRIAVVYRPPRDKKASPSTDDAVLSSGGIRHFPREKDFRPTEDDDDPVARDDVNEPSAYGCRFNFRNYHDNDLVVLKVRYDHNLQQLTVTARHAAEAYETECVTLHMVSLPVGGFFGFTAETGGLSDHHDVVFFHLTPWSSKEEDVAAAVADDLQRALDNGPHHDGFDAFEDAKQQALARASDDVADSGGSGDDKHAGHGEVYAEASGIPRRTSEQDAKRRRELREAKLAAITNRRQDSAEEATTGGEEPTHGQRQASTAASGDDEGPPHADPEVDDAATQAVYRHMSSKADVRPTDDTPDDSGVGGDAADDSSVADKPTTGHESPHGGAAHGGGLPLDDPRVPAGERKFFQGMQRMFRHREARQARMEAAANGPRGNAQQDPAADAPPPLEADASIDDADPPPVASPPGGGGETARARVREWHEDHGDDDIVRARNPRKRRNPERPSR